MNLVDLAGSEKAGQTGAEGARLKEGCAINQSLTVLGMCISTLADHAMGKNKGTVVPFRNSALTKILKTALGGNSKTIMVCALSPSFLNYEETLSTLRYADRAKKIKNQAIINESPQEKIIRELKEENKKLKDAINKFKIAVKQGKEINFDELDKITDDMDQAQQVLEDIQKPFEQKLAEAKEKEREAAASSDVSTQEESKMDISGISSTLNDSKFADPGQV